MTSVGRAGGGGDLTGVGVPDSGSAPTNRRRRPGDPGQGLEPRDVGITTSATITWMTDGASTSTVRYGRTTTHGRARSSTSLVVRHTITVTGLSASTRYHYRVE